MVIVGVSGLIQRSEGRLEGASVAVRRKTFVHKILRKGFWHVQIAGRGSSHREGTFWV